MLNWGIEGESYTVTDGKKTYTDAVLNDPDGKTVAEAIQQWAQPLPGLYKADGVRGLETDHVSAANRLPRMKPDPPACQI